jgi:hypothetical protein
MTDIIINIRKKKKKKKYLSEVVGVILTDKYLI